jgi:hypothetical protein
LAGNPVGGRSPQAVLENIAGNLQSDPGYYKGKSVLLSPGVMNGPDQIDLVPQQIKAIQDAGGKVVLAGVDRGKFAPYNDQLAGIAKQSGVPFAGPLPTDSVHPGPQGYQSYVGLAAPLAMRMAQNGPMTSMPQVSGTGAPVTQAQLGGGAPMPAPSAPMSMPTAGAPSAPAMSPQAAKIMAGLAALALQDRLSTVAGLGNPNQGLIGVFQNSPQMAGARAGAEAGGKFPYDRLVYDPATGKMLFQAPHLSEGAMLHQGPGGELSASAVPGYLPTMAQTTETHAAATERGKTGVEFGNLLPQRPPTFPAAVSYEPSAAPGAPAGQPAEQKPIVSPTGNEIPPLTEQFMPQSPKEIGDAIPAWRETTNKWAAAIEPARQAELRLQTIANAFKMTESGAFTTQKAELAAALKSLGINPAIVGTNPAAVQLALHENILTTLPLLKAATPRPSQIEFVTTSENREHPNIQPEANLQMLGEDIALMRQAQQLPQDWNSAQQAGWRNADSFYSAWNKRNPLEKAAEAVKQEIGPLKGMEAKPAAEAAIPAAQPTAFGRSADGHVIMKLNGQWVDAVTRKPVQ